MLLLALTLLCAACTVGSPLVDEQDLNGGLAALECNLPPRCQPRPWEAPSVRASDPLDLQGCASEARCAPLAASSDEPTLGGAQCGSETVESLPLVAACSRERLRAPVGVSELSYQQSSWSRFDLAIETHTPLQITLRAPELRAVAIRLQGPVTLELEDAHVEDVRISGAANAAGEPRVSIVRMEARVFRVGDLEHSFAGAIVLRASKLREVELYARELHTESTRLEQGSVRVASLSAADTTLLQLDVQSEHTQLAEFDTQDTRLQLCEHATIIGGRIDRSIISACEGSTVRVYATIVGSSALDGAYEADDSNFENSIFGASFSTRVQSFQSRFSSDALCDGLQLLALDAASNIKCSDCDKAFETGDRACFIPPLAMPPGPVRANYCAILPEKGLLPLCDPQLPARMRQR